MAALLLSQNILKCNRERKIGFEVPKRAFVLFCMYNIFSRVHATLHPALSVRRSVGPSVRRSVTLYFLSATEYHSDADYNSRRVGVVVVVVR